MLIIGIDTEDVGSAIASIGMFCAVAHFTLERTLRDFHGAKWATFFLQGGAIDGIVTTHMTPSVSVTEAV
jgi:hypothetical protein